MTTWADIQRLAADLQRVQLAEGAKRLSDANCVEVVSMLMSMGLVDLVVTTDGKEYVTRKHLVTECANECLGAGGRVALTELASQLNVDLDHVQTAVNQLLSQHQSGLDPAEFVVCAGELLHRDFINDLCSRLDGRLQELGYISMLQLTKHWDLSTDLLNQHILPDIGAHPGARISAIRFDDQLYTPRYIGSLRNKLMAILVALTKPMALSNIHSHLGIGQALFFKLWTELSDEEKLPGKLLGTKNSLKSLYIPGIHEKLAKQYIKQRITNDHFIENVLFKRLSIPSEPNVFLKELLPAKEFEDLLFWPSVVLSDSKLWKECDSLAKNLLQTNNFCVLEDILPSQFTFLTDADYAKVIERLQKHGNGSNLRATEDRSVVYEHPQLLEKWLKGVEEFVRERAEKEAPELRKAKIGAAMAAKREGQQTTKTAQKDEWEVERPGKKGGKGGSGKKGGGGGGKGAGKRGTDTDQQNDPLSLVQIPTDDLFAELRRSSEGLGHAELPESLCAELESEFVEAANKIYREKVAEQWQKVESGEQQQQRQMYEQKLAGVVDAYGTICLFEKGAEAFEEPLCSDLRSHLLRTLCTELAQSLLHNLAHPSADTPSPSNFSAKLRDQLIGTLESKEMQRTARELFEALDTMEHFHEALGRMATQAGLVLKQPDKKERSDRLNALGTELRSQLGACSDPPTLLLLAVLLTLQQFHGLAVHASGKFVASLISFISSTKPSVDPSYEELIKLLAHTQKMVVESIKKRRRDGGGEEEGEELGKKLEERMEGIRALFRRSAEGK